MIQLHCWVALVDFQLSFFFLLETNSFEFLRPISKTGLPTRKLPLGVEVPALLRFNFIWEYKALKYNID